MKTNNRKFSILKMGVLALLLAGAGTATAAQVNVDDNGNVLSITNLFLLLDEGTGFYNVNFVRDTGRNLYGTDLSGLPFSSASDTVRALADVNAALNDEPAVPTGASTAGSEIFFTGALSTIDELVGQGSELYDNGTWGPCLVTSDCNDGGVAGQRILDPDAIETYATFSAGVVPVPAAVWLFGSALGVLGWMRRKAS